MRKERTMQNEWGLQREIEREGGRTKWAKMKIECQDARAAIRARELLAEGGRGQAQI
jgi:hypothetical protein